MIGSPFLLTAVKYGIESSDQRKIKTTIESLSFSPTQNVSRMLP